MSHHLRIVSDPDLGSIAEVIDDETGQVLGSCADSPRRADGLMVIVDETSIFEHGYLLPWHSAPRDGDTQADPELS